MNLNKVFILGNLTRDPEIRTLPSGQPVAGFGIATNRFYTDKSGEKKQDVEFHNITAFGKLADISSRYLTKGSLALIEGRLRTSSWQDSAGNKRFRTEIIAQNIQLAPKTMGKMIPATSEGIKQEEIPIIEEENYTPPKEEPKEEKPKEENPEEDKEIDVKDIPF